MNIYDKRSIFNFKIIFGLPADKGSESIRIAKILLEYGDEIDAKDNEFGLTALYKAVKSGILRDIHSNYKFHSVK